MLSIRFCLLEAPTHTHTETPVTVWNMNMNARCIYQCEENNNDLAKLNVGSKHEMYFFTTFVKRTSGIIRN